jgi:hypothetical protein
MRSSLPYSQEPATGFTPRHRNLILRSVSRLLLLLYLGFPRGLRRACYMARPTYPLFNDPNDPEISRCSDCYIQCGLAEGLRKTRRMSDAAGGGASGGRLGARCRPV